MQRPSSMKFEEVATPGLDGPLIKVEVEMEWQGKTRHKPGWVHMQTGEVQLREGEYWCEHPRVNLQQITWDIELEMGVWGGSIVSRLHKLSPESLKAFCHEVVVARAEHLDSTITPSGVTSPSPNQPVSKPRF